MHDWLLLCLNSVYCIFVLQVKIQSNNDLNDIALFDTSECAKTSKIIPLSNVGIVVDFLPLLLNLT